MHNDVCGGGGRGGEGEGGKTAAEAGVCFSRWWQQEGEEEEDWNKLIL